MCYMVCVISAQKVTWLPASRTWLSEGADSEDSIFLRTVKNRGNFCEFYARFFMNAWFISWSTSVFSRYRARVSKHSRPHPLLAIWIEHSDWSIFEFLVLCDFPKTSCTGNIAHSILSSLPLLSTLDTMYTNLGEKFWGFANEIVLHIIARLYIYASTKHSILKIRKYWTPRKFHAMEYRSAHSYKGNLKQMHGLLLWLINLSLILLSQ